MPELPEVETIRRQLSTELVGKKVNNLEIRLPKLVRGSVLIFKKSVVGARLSAVKRRAKLLILQLTNGQSVIIHLKMTGQLIFKNKKQLKIGGHPIRDGEKNLPNKFTQAIFTFSDNSKLFFNDIRKFGYFQLVNDRQLEDFFSRQKYGPEPLSGQFTLDYFIEILKRRKKAKIKQVLMDQTLISGLGNIYATEACFYALVKPTRAAGKISKKEAVLLYQAIKKILSQAVKSQGTSANTYVDAYGQPGRYVPLLKVYGRKNEPCYRCKTKIKAISLGGRGTAFCPRCQK